MKQKGPMQNNALEKIYTIFLIDHQYRLGHA
jgi:hypothetical protein